jgi:hypothetical protein
MPSFENLQKIQEMDFSHMRCVPLNWGDGHCASDAAIAYFVTNLVEFFAQFKNAPPTDEIIAQYVTHMQKITEQINQAEYDYYYNKYQAQFPEASCMAQANKLGSFKKIPARMTCWASSVSGDTRIRNINMHQKALGGLERWERWADMLQTKIEARTQTNTSNMHGFFSSEDKAKTTDEPDGYRFNHGG